jgi:hypothetical protein
MSKSQESFCFFLLKKWLRRDLFRDSGKRGMETERVRMRGRIVEKGSGGWKILIFARRRRRDFFA